MAFIWAVIYVLAAWALLIIWNKTPHDTRFRWIMGGFALSTLVNFAWSIIFFHFHLLVPAIGCALLLGVLTLWVAILTYPRSPKAAFLLAPYIVWVFFAAYLNYAVAVLNP
ncbi:MAG: hypothetical protein EPN84_13625 [Legionella sp.]|nr:MAG: hypothetical protein EPN84_13625 [Legionella sp.]